MFWVMAVVAHVEPAGWASTTPDPATLAVLEGLDLSTLDGPQLVQVLRAGWQQVSHAYALYLAALGETAERCADVAGVDGDWVGCEIGAALSFTARRTQIELDLAQHLRRALPRVWRSLYDGSIDVPKARIFVDHLHERTDQQITRICDRLLPLAPRWTTGQLAARLLREVQAVDPDYTRRRYERAARDRRVWGYLGADGTAVLSAQGLSPAEAAGAAERLQRLAAAVVAAGHPGTENQLRADLFVRLLDGRYTGHHEDEIVAALLAEAAEPAAEPANSEPAPGPASGASAEAQDAGRTTAPSSVEREAQLEQHAEPVPVPSPKPEAAIETNSEARPEPAPAAEPELTAEPGATRPNRSPRPRPNPRRRAPDTGSRSTSGWLLCSVSTTIPPRSPVGDPSPRMPPASWSTGSTPPNGATPSLISTGTSATPVSPADVRAPETPRRAGAAWWRST